MTKINQPSIGLNSLLGSQAFGDLPDNLSQTTLPIVDLLPFLGAHVLRGSRTSAGRTGAGVAVIQTVPVGEAWLLLSASGGMNGPNVLDGATPIHVTMSIRVRMNSQQQFAGVHMGTIQGVVTQWAAGASIGLYFPANIPQPFLLGPGSEIYVNCDEIESVNSQSFELNLLYYRLRV